MLSDLFRNCHCYLKQTQRLHTTHSVLSKQNFKNKKMDCLFIPPGPPSCCNASTKRRCNSGVQHLLCFRNACCWRYGGGCGTKLEATSFLLPFGVVMPGLNNIYKLFEDFSSSLCNNWIKIKHNSQTQILVPS